MKTLVLLFSILLFAPGCLAMPPPVAKVTVKVLDEAGLPVPGASVAVGMGVGHTGSSPTARGVSDASGLFTGELTGYGPIGYGASKEGFYEFGAPLHLVAQSHGLGRRFEPWNPTVVATLRPILNPVPMYVRRVNMNLPELEKDCSFDMIASDWLPPHGSGEVAHITFYGTRVYNGWDDWSATLRVRFMGQTSGYVTHQEDLDSAAGGSRYKLPRYAPESGYVETWEYSRSSAPLSRQDPTMSWVFRTATVEDENGTNLSGLYGKIRGPISFDPRGNQTLELLFIYYLNPDGTRNLEFDGRRNLLKDRRDIFDRERPTAP